jgi:hypothetical protein
MEKEGNMKQLKSVLIMVLALMMVTSGVVMASEGQHWVYDELAEFKQLIFPMMQEAITNKTITKEEWMSVHATVLNDIKLDDPIQTYHWALGYIAEDILTASCRKNG